jgi:hypothetical protein
MTQTGVLADFFHASFQRWIEEFEINEELPVIMLFHRGHVSLVFDVVQPFFRVSVHADLLEEHHQMFQQIDAMKTDILDRIAPLLPFVHAINVRRCNNDDLSIPNVQGWTYTDSGDEWNNWFFGRIVLSVSLVYPSQQTEIVIDLLDIRGLDTTLKDIKRYLYEDTVSVEGGFILETVSCRNGMDNFEIAIPINVDGEEEDSITAFALMEGIKLEIACIENPDHLK